MQSWFSDLEEKMVSFPAGSRIVVIGGGPAGLLTGILFDKKGFDATVVEKRQEYTRSTHYVDLVFRQMNEMLAAFHIPQHRGSELPLFVKPSYANHIKDVENSLSEYIENETAIVIVHGEYSTHSTAGVHIKYPSKMEGILPYDILVDCTGYHTFVLNEINRLHGTPIFTREIVDTSPHSKYIQAGVLVFKETEKVRMVFPDDAELPEEESKDDELPQMSKQNAIDRAMAELHEMGWKFAAVPKVVSFLSLGINPEKKREEEQGIKHRFSSEVPDELKKEQVIPWINACLRANYGIDELPFRVELIKPPKNPAKKQYDIYEFIPKYTMPYFYVDEANSKLYLHFGDSSFNHLFSEGAGLRRTFLELTSFFKKTKMNEAGEIEIELGRFAEWCERDLEYHFGFIKKEFKKRREELKLLNSEQKELNAAIESLEKLKPKVNPNRFFQLANNPFQPVIDQLLQNVVMGNLNEARKILAPFFSHLIFEPGAEVKDLCGNTLVGYSPFKLACYTHDIEMLELMMKDLKPDNYKKFKEGLQDTYNALLDQQKSSYDFNPLIYVMAHGNDQQIKSAFNAFREYFQAREIKDEASFNIINLVNAYRIAKEKFASWSDKDRFLYWSQAIGWLQRMLSSTCYAQAICSGLYYIAGEKKPLMRTLDLVDDTPFYVMQIDVNYNRGFGLNYAIEVTLQGGAASRALNKDITDDLSQGYTSENLSKLVELKKAGLLRLIELTIQLENKQSLTGP